MTPEVHDAVIEVRRVLQAAYQRGVAFEPDAVPGHEQAAAAYFAAGLALQIEMLPGLRDAARDAFLSGLRSAQRSRGPRGMG